MTRRSCILKFFVPLFAAGSSLFAQAPAINAGGIVNHFSRAAQTMPNGSIAQGSLFDINGRNLGPADPVQVTDTPLATALSGVSAQVSIGGRSIDVLISSVSATKIVALLPSSTPIGTGTLTVSVNGVRSATAGIVVVKASLGIQTVNGAGYGPALMNMSDGSGGFVQNSRDLTIQPGQTAVFFATGAGPKTFDETAGAPSQELDLDLHAYIGGQEAQIVYKGSAPGKVGIDEIDVIIPDGTAAGCNVSVIFVTGSLVSNGSTISVGDGSSCAQNVNPLPTEGFLKSGAIELVRAVVRLPIPVPGITTQDILSDLGSSAFSSIDFSKVVQTQQVPWNTVIGPCNVGTLPTPQQDGGPDTGAVSYLDAGTSIGVKGPNGSRTLAKQLNIGYSSQLGQDPVFPGQPNPGPPYVVPGEYTFDNGAGGKDIAPFQVKFTMVQPALWPTLDALQASGITRSEGLDFTWTPGADPEALISIAGTSRLPGQGQQPGAQFSCSVKEKDANGHLFVPAIVLMVLPASGTTNSGPTGVFSATWTSTAPLNLPEIEQGTMVVGVSYTRSLLYK